MKARRPTSRCLRFWLVTALAAHMVSLWSKIRHGDVETASVVFQDMMFKHMEHYAAAPDVPKAEEAMDCSLAMFAWRKEHRPK